MSNETNSNSTMKINSSSQLTANNVNQIIDMYKEDIKLYLKRYKEEYAKSDSNEQKAIQELDLFFDLIREYKNSLETKLQNYKNKISSFSRIIINK